eukprot:Skav205276  [mRNA]  locus=scaffold1841:219209:220539:+ [translate_table: standard]
MDRNASEIRLIATPEGLEARLIFIPESITASHCSGLNVHKRSATPSPNSFTLMKIWIRCSTGATVLTLLRTTPVGFRACSTFNGEFITEDL